MGVDDGDFRVPIGPKSKLFESFCSLASNSVPSLNGVANTSSSGAIDPVGLELCRSFILPSCLCGLAQANVADLLVDGFNVGDIVCLESS